MHYNNSTAFRYRITFFGSDGVLWVYKRRNASKHMQLSHLICDNSEIQKIVRAGRVRYYLLQISIDSTYSGKLSHFRRRLI